MVGDEGSRVVELFTSTLMLPLVAVVVAVFLPEEVFLRVVMVGSFSSESTGGRSGVAGGVFHPNHPPFSSILEAEVSVFVPSIYLSFDAV